MELPDSDPSVDAAAAAWLARMRADDRTPADERRFQAWLASDPRHRRVFDELAELWDSAGAKPPNEAPRSRPAVSRRALMTAGVALIATSGAAALWIAPHREHYKTAVGEQRRLTLADGSNLMLDTDTAISVRIGRSSRQIGLMKGRANFDVAADTNRPFVVTAGKHSIRALGTAFDVRHETARVEIMMIEGSALVEAAGENTPRPMNAGSRIVLDDHRIIAADWQDLMRATAWQRGYLIFKEDRLADAIVEVNRYSPTPIILSGADVSGQTISGVYAIGKTSEFAQSVATLLDMDVENRPDGLLLRPHAASRA